MANEAKQGQVKLVECSLSTLEGKTFSLMNQIDDITFKEDLDSHFITGTVSITEGFNLVEAFPLTGDELFVLELANNHWGNMQRGLKIIQDYANVVHKNKIKASIVSGPYDHIKKNPGKFYQAEISLNNSVFSDLIIEC